MCVCPIALDRVSAPWLVDVKTNAHFVACPHPGRLFVGFFAALAVCIAAAAAAAGFVQQLQFSGGSQLRKSRVREGAERRSGTDVDV